MTKARTLKRPAERRWTIVAAVCAVVGAIGAMTGTGFGVSAGQTAVVGTSVNETISLTPPSALDAASSGVTLSTTSGDAIAFGSFSGQQSASASATWHVSTNDPNGYQLMLDNGRASGATLQTSDGKSWPDMGSSPGAVNTTVSAFGASAGSLTGASEPGVHNATSGAAPASSFAGVSNAGTLIGSETSAAANDPVTLNFVLNLSSTQPIAAGTYAGTTQLTATAL